MIDDPWLILSYYLCTTPVLPPSLLAAIASIPVSLVSYLLVHWVPDFTVVVTFFFLLGEMVSTVLLKIRPLKLMILFANKTPSSPHMLDLSYTILNMNEQWFFIEAIMIVV